MSRKLLIVHELSQVDRIEKYLEQFGPEVDVCCYRPEVFEAAKQKGCSVVPLDSGCSIADLRRIRDRALDILRAVNAHMYAYLKRAYDDVVNPTFLNSVHYNCYLNMVLNTYLVPYNQLCGILATDQHSGVIDVRGSEDISEFDKVFSNKMQARPAISFSMACRRYGVAYTSFVEKSYKSRGVAADGVRSSLHRFYNIVRRLQNVLPGLKREVGLVLANLLGTSRIIISLNGYDFPWISPRVWGEQNYKITAWSGKRLLSGYKAGNQIDAVSDRMKHDLLPDISRRSNLEDIERLVIKHVLTMFLDFFAGQLDVFLFVVRDGQRRCDDVRIICAPVVHLGDVALVSALRYRGARVISWQHGGNYGYMDLPMFLYHDLANCDVFLGYGVSAREYANMYASVLDSDCYRRCDRVEVVGTYRIPTHVAKRDGRMNRVSDKLHVLYPFRDYQSVVVNLANAWIMTSLMYYEFQKGMISAIGDLEWVKMTAQPHPSESAESIEAIRSWSESNGYQNIRFGEPGSYSSVVANADVVLCEFPSTTFLEALWAGVPVILYQLSGAYELVDRYFEELGDAIHMVSNSAELIEVLANLRNGCNVSMCQFAKAEALIVGRVSGFSGEHQLWQSILK